MIGKFDSRDAISTRELRNIFTELCDEGIFGMLRGVCDYEPNGFKNLVVLSICNRSSLFGTASH